MRFDLHDEEGAAAATVALGIVALLATAMIAIDAGSILQTRRGLVADTDAAALATAIELLDDRCASDSTARTHAEAMAAANDPDTIVTDVVVDRGGNCTTGYGTVEVSTENPAALFFAPMFGYSTFLPDAQSTAVYGRIRGLEGLRPIGLCAIDPHYQEWVALQNVLRTAPTSDDAVAQAAYDSLRGSIPSEHPVYAGAGVVHRIRFERLNAPGGDCNPLGMPAGNWGWLDFDGGANSNNDLNNWIADGYPGMVDLGLSPNPGDEDCDDTQSGLQDCDAMTGGRGQSTRNALNSITCAAGGQAGDDDCPVFYILVYDAIGGTTGNGGGGGNNGGGNNGGGNNGGGNNGGGNNNGGANGANTEYHPASFLGVTLRAHDLGTGQVFDDTSWIDLEFVDEYVNGQIGPSLPVDPFPGPRGVQLCATEHFDNC